MTSPKQIEANRRNAGFSTGPQSAAGKAVVSQNAVRHGLRAQKIVIDGESQAEFDDFRNRLIAEQAPADPLEMLLVDRIAAGFWRLRRTGQIESQMFDEMRQSLVAQEKQANAADDLRFDDILPEDIPDFFREGVDPDGTDPDPVYLDGPDLLAAIAAMKDKYAHNRRLFEALSEWEQSLEAVAEIPSGRYSVPAVRQCLQALSERLPRTGGIPEQSLTDCEQAIEVLRHVEASIARRRTPSLGKTLCRDFKGPDCLGKFMRYESQIEHGLFRTLHELQRLQARRASQPVCPPVVVDVDLSGDPGA
jgi:hypothetical protein